MPDIEDEDLKSISEKIKNRLSELQLAFWGAVVFAFLVSILAGIIIDVLFGGILNAALILIIIVDMICLVFIVCFLYYRYAFLPYKQIKCNIQVPIIYDQSGRGSF